MRGGCSLRSTSLTVASSGSQRGFEFGQELLSIPFAVSARPIGYEVLYVILDELIPSFRGQAFHFAIFSPLVFSSMSLANHAVWTHLNSY